MMKKARKVTINKSPSPPSYQFAAEESRARIKIRALMLDYEDVVKETEAKKKRLQAAKKNKQNLLAQVKFLRRRYNSLMNNPPQSSLYQTSYEPQQTGPSTQAPLQYQKIPPAAYGAQPRACGVKTGVKSDLARKAKAHHERESAVSTIPASFDLNQTAFHPSSKPHLIHRSSPACPTQTSDFPTKEKCHRGKGVAIPSTSAVLDLNQAAVPTLEEVEYRSAWEAPAWEQPAKHHAMEADRTTADLALAAACRNMGKATGRNGKRKISWQDQVALRV